MILGGQGCQIIIVLLLLENDSYLGYLCYLYLEVLIIPYLCVKYQVQIVFSNIKWIACNQADLPSWHPYLWVECPHPAWL